MSAIRLSLERRRLANGLTLLVSENHRLPLVSLNAFVTAGLDQNPLEHPGLAAMTARLLDEGTRHLSALEIAQRVEGTGGSLSAFSDRELSGLSMYIHAAQFDPSLLLLHEMLVVPSFPEDRFRLEQQKVLNRLESFQDDPQMVAAHRFRTHVYRGSPLQYPVLGTPESVRTFTPGMLARFHQTRYAPQNTILVVVGAVQASQVCSRVEEVFGEWENPMFQPQSISLPQKQAAPLLEEFPMEREQCTIILGHLGISRDNPDYHALQVLDAVLGNGPGLTSRIARRLREEMGLAYHTYADIAGTAGRLPGRWEAFISTDPRNREAAIEQLIAEVDAVRRHGIQPEELSRAVDYLTGSFVFEFETLVGVARFLLAAELYQLGLDYPERYPEMVRRVSRRQLQEVARKYLDTVNYTTVIVGPIHGEHPR